MVRCFIGVFYPHAEGKIGQNVFQPFVVDPVLNCAFVRSDCRCSSHPCTFRCDQLYVKGDAMSRKLYAGILIAVTVIGILSTIALMIYTVELYGNVSIISYIANGR